MLKILHIAPQNYAGVPYDFYKMHIECGDESRLITLHKNPNTFPEDICLNLPLPNYKLAKLWRRKKMVSREAENPSIVPAFEPKNILEKYYFQFNDKLKRNIIEKTIEQYNLNDFDIIHYDAGLDFYRDSSQAKKWKNEGKKIVCCYFGSDLRTRGIIKELDEISDLNITSEFDHLALKKDLQYLFYPYDSSELPKKKNGQNDKIRIIHTPTNRKYKGTELIISVIEKINKEKKIEFILLENTPRSIVLEEKSKSDICIDQVGGTMGGTGYGKAGLESLAMGIPTITNMTVEYQKWLPENPFVVANNADELYLKLNELIADINFRNEFGEKGKLWVQNYHNFESVNRKLYQLYKEAKII
ncbi:MAG: hypothetical protein NTX22_06550 [Ignavibacteriales bacterium]|nr:hypothetical protein [Ignavibacteriales bacterium]